MTMQGVLTDALRAAMTRKLQEIDEDLVDSSDMVADFVNAMLSNGKPKSHINNELAEVIGESEAAELTDWLYSMFPSNPSTEEQEQVENSAETVPSDSYTDALPNGRFAHEQQRPYGHESAIDHINHQQKPRRPVSSRLGGATTGASRLFGLAFREASQSAKPSTKSGEQPSQNYHPARQPQNEPAVQKAGVDALNARLKRRLSAALSNIQPSGSSETNASEPSSSDKKSNPDFKMVKIVFDLPEPPKRPSESASEPISSESKRARMDPQSNRTTDAAQAENADDQTAFEYEISSLKNTDMDFDAASDPTSQSRLVKCRFFPHCIKGESCPFWHPVKACQAYPECPSGSTCMYLHPSDTAVLQNGNHPKSATTHGSMPCKFGARCNDSMCRFAHPSAPVSPAGFANGQTIQHPNIPVLCRHYPNCSNPHCRFYHPSSTSSTPTSEDMHAQTNLEASRSVSDKPNEIDFSRDSSDGEGSTMSPAEPNATILSSALPSSFKFRSSSTDHSTSSNTSTPVAAPTAPANSGVSTKMCWYGIQCMSANCPFMHPPRNRSWNRSGPVTSQPTKPATSGPPHQRKHISERTFAVAEETERVLPDRDNIQPQPSS